ncbi:hypothetical protein BC941DRAFT_413710 [Chlamydoabsidia padenii]|nr:hypothetical protein BC941DRAFT_413710 [Chlamydoabsidia padenii]
METHLSDHTTDSSPRRTTTITEVTEEEEEDDDHQQETSLPLESSSAEETNTSVIFTERKRSLFSYDANELRRRTATTSSSTHSKTASSGTTHSQQQQQHSSNDTGFYECNICFDTATYPVLTLCGHLFCWSCLAQWLNAQSRNPTCPVCKAGCGKDKVIPIYGRGKEEKDPRNDPSIPTRPAGQRPAPLRDPNRPGTSFFGQNVRGGTYNSRNVTFSGGIGFFPFGISFNFPVNGSPTDLQSQAHQNAFMSRLFLMILSLVIVAIIFY